MIIMIFKKRCLRIRNYLHVSGWALIILTMLVSIMIGLYNDYSMCKDFEKPMILIKPEPDSTNTPYQAFYEHYQAKIKHCQQVESNIYISYSMIILGVAFLVGGYIIKE